MPVAGWLNGLTSNAILTPVSPDAGCGPPSSPRPVGEAVEVRPEDARIRVLAARHLHRDGRGRHGEDDLATARARERRDREREHGALLGSEAHPSQDATAGRAGDDGLRAEEEARVARERDRQP